MQRIVEWTEGDAIFSPVDNPKPHFLGGSYEADGTRREYANDLDSGAVFALDLTECDLSTRPELREALSFGGRLGRIVSHNFAVVGACRIWTFVVEF